MSTGKQYNQPATPANMEASQITVLISGRGSNMQAIHRACIDGSIKAQVSHVISNSADAAGLDYALQHGIPTSIVNHKDFTNRSDFDAALINSINKNGQPDLVLLAGFMRRLTATFTNHYAGYLINIHPSLLPRHPGLDTHAKALQCGDKWHGCSVHFVNEALDGGPVIARGIVPVIAGDTEATLAERVLATEHRVFPTVVQRFLHDGLACRDGHIQIHGTNLTTPLVYYYY